MAFDLSRFAQAEFRARTKAIPVPGLKAFFAEGDKPEWLLRNLTASEVFLATEAAKRQSSVDAIVRAISSSGDQAQTIRKAIGLGIVFLVEAYDLQSRARDTEDLSIIKPMRLFHFSNAYLALLFVAAAADPFIG